MRDQHSPLTDPPRVVHLPAERHKRIIQSLKETGFVTVAGLSDALDVSDVTVRRDLSLLESQHLLQRTHGGATTWTPIVRDRPVSEKAGQHAQEKRRIGAAAAALIEDHDRVILASGTTVSQVASHLGNLHGQAGLTVVTNAMNVAMALTSVPGIEVHMLGGAVRHTSTSVAGPIAEMVLSQFSCRKLFLGVDGFDLQYGLTTSSALEAHLNTCMIEAAEQVIVVADASKFGLRSFGRICGIEQVHHVITSEAIPPRMVATLEDASITVTVV